MDRITRSNAYYLEEVGEMDTQKYYKSLVFTVGVVVRGLGTPEVLYHIVMSCQFMSYDDIFYILDFPLKNVKLVFVILFYELGI
jgi:hypothetical protein